ncbi:Zinc metalloproteinase nas-25 (Nematode astacin 25) [Durusdinium trenchii]|uniref:Metalloendopeptidase n=1 Tax=Durusdinium trenchii TaxID=1381693 RepID=A0ABP0RKA0_9DINO
MAEARCLLGSSFAPLPALDPATPPENTPRDDATEEVAQVSCEVHELELTSGCRAFSWPLKSLAVGTLLLLVLVGLATAVPALPWARPPPRATGEAFSELAIADPTKAKVDKVAQLVLQLVHEKAVQEEATKVRKVLQTDKLMKDQSEQIMDLLRSLETRLTPTDAARLGVEITVHDIAKILYLNNPWGEVESVEDMKPDAFQGDMVPVNVRQLKAFADVAERKLVPSTVRAQRAQQRARQKRHARRHLGDWMPELDPYAFGVGETWENATVPFCFHSKTAESVKDAVRKAVMQFLKAVPCIKFQEVDYKSGDRCEGTGPSVLITSDPGGFWSHVGMLRDYPQRVNLQHPGCDTVGTALHQLGHTLGMAHEQSRPDRDKYVHLHPKFIQEDSLDKFNMAATTHRLQRPYDMLSIMHYDARAFSKNDFSKTVTPTDSAYEVYTQDPAKFEQYKLGNRIGLTQFDADQLADLYQFESGFCVSQLLTSANEAAACQDLQKDGKAWKDASGRDCETYVRMEKNGSIDSCRFGESRKYCCECGGGLKLEEWSWECDLCQPVSLNGCSCAAGPWEIKHYRTSKACGTPGLLVHYPVCKVSSCPKSFSIEGLLVDHCAMYTGFTTKGCQCRRQPKGWTYKGVHVEGTCGNPSKNPWGDWCFVEKDQIECQKEEWGICEHAKP